MLTLEELKAANSESELTDGFDPYLCHVPMPLRRKYYPLGFPLELTTNSPEVLDAAEESWGVFKPRFDLPPIKLRVGVLESEATECPPALTFRAQRNLLVNIADNANFCVNDLVQGFSFAWLTTAAVSRRGYLRFHFLEAAALSHIANRFAAPVHGACVTLAGSGVLLCGDSGAGKSSLAFACARAGWTYTTDDASFLLNGRDDRQVVGNCHLFRFRPSAVALFPEIGGRALTPRALGKPSIEVPSASLPGIRAAETSNVDFVVFLSRCDTDIPRLAPFPRDLARRFMAQRLHGMDLLRSTQQASVERLLTAEVLELRYRDLDSAVDRLERLVRERR